LDRIGARAVLEILGGNREATAGVAEKMLACVDRSFPLVGSVEIAGVVATVEVCHDDFANTDQESRPLLESLIAVRA
jgi:hypothetical protein